MRLDSVFLEDVLEESPQEIVSEYSFKSGVVYGDKTFDFLFGGGAKCVCDRESDGSRSYCHCEGHCSCENDCGCNDNNGCNDCFYHGDKCPWR